LDQLSDRLWNGHTIDVGVFNLAFNLSMPVDQENLGNRPVLGTLKPASNLSHQKRKSQDMRRDDQLLLPPQKRNPWFLVSLMICLFVLLCAQTRKPALFAASQNINVDHVQKSLSTSKHLWRWGNLSQAIMTFQRPLGKWADT
jgi:hypothetical protein